MRATTGSVMIVAACKSPIVRTNPPTRQQRSSTCSATRIIVHPKSK